MKALAILNSNHMPVDMNGKGTKDAKEIKIFFNLDKARIYAKECTDFTGHIHEVVYYEDAKKMLKAVKQLENWDFLGTKVNWFEENNNFAINKINEAYALIITYKYGMFEDDLLNEYLNSENASNIIILNTYVENANKWSEILNKELIPYQYLTKYTKGIDKLNKPYLFDYEDHLAIAIMPIDKKQSEKCIKILREYSE